MTTLLKLFTTNKYIFNDYRNDEMQELIEKSKKEFEEIKNSFPKDNINKIETLLLRQEDYIKMVELEKKENYIMLALKIGIELGRCFEVFGDF